VRILVWIVDPDELPILGLDDGSGSPSCGEHEIVTFGVGWRRIVVLSGAA
jgi:hypothetical protein